MCLNMYSFIIFLYLSNYFKIFFKSINIFNYNAIIKLILHIIDLWINYILFLEFVNALGEPGDDYDENDEDEEDIYPQMEIQT